MSTFESIGSTKKKKPKEDLWLLSYADLTTNLMAVFIMMLAISKVDMQRFDAISSNISSRAKQENSLEELQKKLNAQIAKNKLEKKVQTDLGLFGLNVTFVSGGFFESASADISNSGLQESLPLLKILSKTDAKYILSFEGHTDDVPMKNSKKFRDNWDLSTARGSSFLVKMKEMGVLESRMSVAGFAHTQPKESIKDKTGVELEKARAQNRRVVIRVSQ